MATMKGKATRGAAPVDAAYAARLADLKVATRTIGDTGEARLRWVAGFVREKPAEWHSATRAAHGDCLVALTSPVPDFVVGGVNLPPPLTPAEVDALHGELGAFLRAVVNAPVLEPVEVPTVGLREAIVRATAPGVKPAIFGATWGAVDARTAILQAVKRLILDGTASARLLACPNDGAPFVAVRKQRFCEDRCAQQARNKRNAPRRRKGGR